MKQEVNLAALLAATAASVPVTLVFELAADGRTPERACVIRSSRGSKASVRWAVGSGPSEIDASKLRVMRLGLDRDKPVGLLLDVEGIA